MARKVTKEKAKAVDEQVREYELAVIFSPELTEEGMEASVNRVSQFITDRNGTIDNVDNWGKKRLAYPIGHFLEGNYVIIRLQMIPSLVKEIETSLQIAEDILRYLLIRPNS